MSFCPRTITNTNPSVHRVAARSAPRFRNQLNELFRTYVSLYFYFLCNYYLLLQFYILSTFLHNCCALILLCYLNLTADQNLVRIVEMENKCPVNTNLKKDKFHLNNNNNNFI